MSQEKDGPYRDQLAAYHEQINALVSQIGAHLPGKHIKHEKPSLLPEAIRELKRLERLKEQLEAIKGDKARRAAEEEKRTAEERKRAAEVRNAKNVELMRELLLERRALVSSSEPIPSPQPDVTTVADLIRRFGLAIAVGCGLSGSVDGYVGAAVLTLAVAASSLMSGPKTGRSDSPEVRKERVDEIDRQLGELYAKATSLPRDLDFEMRRR